MPFSSYWSETIDLQTDTQTDTQTDMCKAIYPHFFQKGGIKINMDSLQWATRLKGLSLGQTDQHKTTNKRWDRATTLAYQGLCNKQSCELPTLCRYTFRHGVGPATPISTLRVHVANQPVACLTSKLRSGEYVILARCANTTPDQGFQLWAH